MTASLYFATLLALCMIGNGAEVDWASASLRDMYDNCEPLSKDFNVWWTMDRQKASIWFALEADIDHDEYMAFGLSGDSDAAEMVGADVVVADFMTGSARARDFFLSDARPCDEDQRAGVCPDAVFQGGHDDVDRVFGAEYRDVAGRATVVHYTRPVQARDPKLDLALDEGNKTVVFAIGALNARSYPTGHRAVAQAKKQLDFGRSRAQNCAPLMGADRLKAALVAKSDRKTKSATTIAVRDAATPSSVALPSGRRRFAADAISDRVLVFSLGPSGVDQPPIVYYVNGRPAPVLRLKRGLNYTFQIMTGRNEHEPMYYHPVVIRANNATAEPVIGPAKGRLCLWSSTLKRQDVPADFDAFRRSLGVRCDQGPYDYFSWTPDRATPAALQYGSAAAPDLGCQIEIVN